MKVQVFVITVVRRKEVTQGDGEHTYFDGSEGEINISWDSLVKIHVKVDKRVSIEYHSVLKLFILHLNKWFLYWHYDKMSASKKFKFVARMKGATKRLVGKRWSIDH